MNSEQRLDRLERIAKLFVRAGIRERRNRNELDEKINIIVNYQIANEERFARNEERFARTDTQIKALAEAQSETRKIVNELAVSQKRTDERLSTLIDIVTKDRNGKSG
jgi:hypothetical protein